MDLRCPVLVPSLPFLPSVSLLSFKVISGKRTHRYCIVDGALRPSCALIRPCLGYDLGLETPEIEGDGISVQAQPVEDMFSGRLRYWVFAERLIIFVYCLSAGLVF